MQRDPEPVDPRKKLIQMIGGLVLQLAEAETRVDLLTEENGRLRQRLQQATGVAEP